ncbi:MAG TPA: hypothetical protein PK961_15255 [bacterium]|nr:hypothetical protein [bacterium]
MKDPRNWSWMLVIIVIAAGLVLTTMSCASDDDDDDDEDKMLFGDEIAGVYPVLLATEENTCPEGDDDGEEELLLTIEQSEDLSIATVYRQEIGGGSEKSKFFQGEVYGRAIVQFEVQKTKFGDLDCFQIHTVDYHLNVDPETAAVTGYLSDNIFYLGAGCVGTVDCRTERTVTPNNDLGDDDDDDDDTQLDDDTTE